MKYCKNCGSELENSKCKNCTKEKKKGKKYIVIGIIIAILVVIVTVLYYSYDKYLDKCFDYEYEIEDVSKRYLKLENYNINKISKNSNIALKDIINKGLINNKLNDKCDGYVLIDENQKIKSYIKCGKIYYTTGYNSKYAKKTNIKVVDNSKIASRSATTAEKETNEKIFIDNDSEVQELNNILNKTNAKFRLFYTLGSCVNEDDFGEKNIEYCKKSMIDKNTTYFASVIDRIRYTKMYISDNRDNIPEAVKGEYTYVTVSKEIFNKYMKKLFDNELSDSDFSNETYKKFLDQDENGNIKCNEVDGMGMVSYVMVVSKTPIKTNEVYSASIDLLKVDDAWHEYKVSDSYNKDDVLGSMTLKYKIDSAGNRQIISLSYNK